MVAHETGHAVLDAIRPDLWDSQFVETAAFHEAFADCTAILTALIDRPTRAVLLNQFSGLDDVNPVETVTEELAAFVKREKGAANPSAEPRHAFNSFRWQLPADLRSSGEPSVLSSESHSFARVFSGCFYDLIRFIFAAQPNRNGKDLLNSALIAGKLLGAGAQQAPETPRFYESVGRTMVLIDQTSNQGANRDAIIQAFRNHGIDLSKKSRSVGKGNLSGAWPKSAARTSVGAIFNASAETNLRKCLGVAPKAELKVQHLRIGLQEVEKVSQILEIQLKVVSKTLEGVVARVTESLLIDDHDQSPMFTDCLHDPRTTELEVKAFVTGLLDRGRISYSNLRGAIAPIARGQPDCPTHAIVKQNGKLVLSRLRFT